MHISFCFMPLLLISVAPLGNNRRLLPMRIIWGQHESIPIDHYHSSLTPEPASKSLHVIGWRKIRPRASTDGWICVHTSNNRVGLYMKVLRGWYIYSGIEDRVEYKDHFSWSLPRLPRYLTDSAPSSLLLISTPPQHCILQIFSTYSRYDISYPLGVVVIIGALFEDTITTHHWRPYHNVKKMGQKYYR